MKKINQLLALLTAVLLALTGMSLSALAEETDTVLATVGERPIYKSAVDAIAADLTYEYYTSQGVPVSDEEALYINQVAMDYAIQLAVLDWKCDEMNIVLTDEEMAALTEENAAEWESAVAYYMQAYFGITDGSTEEEMAAARIQTLALLESIGYTEQGQLEDAVTNQRYSKIEQIMIASAVVDDAAARAAFDAQVASDKENFEDNIYLYELYKLYGYPILYTPEGYRSVLQILLEVDSELLGAYTTASAQLAEQAETEEDLGYGVTQETVDAARAAAIASIQPVYDEIARRLGEGESFESLISEYNTDPGMEDPEQRAEGYLVHHDSVLYDGAFVEAAFSVNEIGQTSQPYLGMYGAYVVYYLRDVPAGPAEYTPELAAEYAEYARNDAESAAFSATMHAWIAEANVVYTEAGEPYRMPEEE